MEDLFKNEFKFYKRRSVPIDLSNVIDLDFHQKYEGIISCRDISKSEEIFSGLTGSSTWKVYDVISIPGLVFLRNPFTLEGQVYWLWRCLYDYANGKNPSNLHALEDNISLDNLLHSINVYKGLYSKLRWTTLGYHHNWDTKIYNEEERGRFPQDLANLARYLIKTLNLGEFTAEAAIINFYSEKDCLSSHQDVSEKNMVAPLLSISFGNPAVFLIGGANCCEKPIPLLLRTGDIVIMAGESRLSYHAIPRILIDESISSNFSHCDFNLKHLSPLSCEFCRGIILENSSSQELDNNFCISCGCRIYNNCDLSEGRISLELSNCFKYISSHRINMNVRQVN